MDQENLLSQGITAARVGQKAEARRVLQKALALDPRNEKAWLWLSAVVESDDQRIECLKRVLRINPDHDTALKAIARLKATSPIVAPPAPEPTAKDRTLQSPALMPMPAPHCLYCGAETWPEARFCSSCGQSLPITITPTPHSQPAPPPPSVPVAQPRVDIREEFTINRLPRIYHWANLIAFPLIALVVLAPLVFEVISRDLVQVSFGLGCLWTVLSGLLDRRLRGWIILVFSTAVAVIVHLSLFAPVIGWIFGLVFVGLVLLVVLPIGFLGVAVYLWVSALTAILHERQIRGL